MSDPDFDDNDKRIEKSADAYRTISEVASDIDVPQHVLRFWETKFPQIKPLKRAGGRRYYRPEDILLLRQVRAWLYVEGYTIKGVQKILREGGVKLALQEQEAANGQPGDSAPREAPAGRAAAPLADTSSELRTIVGDLIALRDRLRGSAGD